MVRQGKELKICWEGGNDSGWIFLEIDGNQIDWQTANATPEMDSLVRLMDDYLDYGSWAGDFSASGEAVYDPTTKSFNGVDRLQESDNESWPTKIFIKIPKAIWFDTFTYSIEYQEGDRVTITSEFIIKNGFLTEEHETTAEKISEDITAGVEKAVNEFCESEDTGEFNSLWTDDDLNRSEFEEVGDHLVYIIDSLSMGISNTTENDVILELKSEDDE